MLHTGCSDFLSSSDQSHVITDLTIERRTSLPEAIVQAFAQFVADGGMKPGDRIPPEGELADAWKVGRSSVREAFRVFQLLGVVEAKPGRGTILANTAPLFALIDWSRFTDASAIWDIVEARLVLEPALARLAAERATEPDLERIAETIERSREAIGDAEASIQAGLDFHTAVAAATGNQTLLLATSLLRNLYFESTRYTRRDAENDARLLRDHEEIYEAIKGRNPEEAARKTEGHLRHGIDLSVRALAEADGSSSPARRRAKRPT